ncbi:MAG: 3-deoxy-D-manno-octulosonatecytidylyltransferase [Bacteroidota bacterium]|nr:3-deoxy-D-manno-octulosonatecytidylyltransferase [Bacteroidota bacterium]
MKILGIIPARYESARFPGKPLADIGGKPMIQRVYEQCIKTKNLSKVIVATDDFRIFDAVKQFGNVVMTHADHLNGTSRCAEVLEMIKNEGFDYVINIQGDEPLIHPEQIDELAILFRDETAQIVTQAIKEHDLVMLDNPNIVKVIMDEKNFAIDFQRKSTVYPNQPFYKHIGIYGFTTEVLKQIVHLLPTSNEKERKLEQMRWLDHGYLIKVGVTQYESVSVDVPSDVEEVLKFLPDK